MSSKPPSQDTLPLDGGTFTLDQGDKPGEDTLLPPPPSQGPASAQETPDRVVDTWHDGLPPTPKPSEPALGFGSDAHHPAPSDPPLRYTVLPRDENPDKPLPRYRLEQHLGRGGMGEVEAVLDNDIGRLVAVKRRRVGLEDRAGLARFADEIRTVGQLEHPNIVPIHDVGVDDLGRHYFTMKYVDGETLADIIKRLKAGDRVTHAQYGFEERVRIFRGACEAVDFAHDRGILHRDLKPANIMVGKYGEVTVLDWGLARPLDPDEPEPEHETEREPVHGGGRMSDTRRGQVLGTPAYMSPEQARGEPLDARSDVYALCVILHELVGLEHYLDGVTSSAEAIDGVQRTEPKLIRLPRHPVQGTAPMDLLWFVHGGIQKDKDLRYPSVKAMLHRLDERAEGRIPVQCHVTFTQRVLNELTRIAVRHPFAALAGYALAAVAIVVAVVVGVS